MNLHVYCTNNLKKSIWKLIVISMWVQYFSFSVSKQNSTWLDIKMINSYNTNFAFGHSLVIDHGL